MRTARLVCWLSVVSLFISPAVLPATGLPVVSSHPRILLTPESKARLLAKRDAGDPTWIRLKDRADQLKTYAIHQFKYASRTDHPDNSIFYDYQGEGWLSAAVPLGLAYQMTGDASYADKLLALVDEMIRAQSDPDNLPPNGYGPLVPDNYYSTRNCCPVLALAYDWCYDRLGTTRKAAMIALMNAWYTELSDSAYQRNDHSDGNYFVGHLYGTAMMGYASYGDNAKAQEMIDWSRVRFDNAPSDLITPDHVPEDYFAQLFEGGTRPQCAREYNGRNITGAPFKGGFDFQGWAYGTATYNMIIDYLLVVKSATGEDLIAAHQSWFSQILRALKHGLMPNRFEMDATGDYGGDYGAVIFRSLPVRLAYVLASSADGPGAQHFAYDEIAKTSPYPDFPDDIYQLVYQPVEWEDFYFTDLTRPSTELTEPPYYSAFGPPYPQGGETNGAIPYFIMRSDWSDTATWASIHQGAAYYDDHQHNDAGTIVIKRADDYLLVDAANWKGDVGSIGIVGSSQNSQYDASAAANTLFVDDYGDYQYPATDDSRFCGGQGSWGRDEVMAAEQTDGYTYVRSDLASAYDHGADTTDPAARTVEQFDRSFACIPGGDVFVVYDRTKIRPSSNPLGPYRAHLRWHCPNEPQTASASLEMRQGNSRLDMAFLLPENLSLTAVDERQNPDPCAGTIPDCNPYGFNSGTWRVEERDMSAALSTNYLTVLHPSARDVAPIAANTVIAEDGKMTGANVLLGDGRQYVVMFAEGSAPGGDTLRSLAYAVRGAARALHLLTGLKPSTHYAVTIDEPNVTVVENANGASVTSVAGVLRFGAAVAGVESPEDVSGRSMLSANRPNPFSTSTTIAFRLPRRERVTIVVHDALGRAVRTAVSSVLSAGDHGFVLEATGLPDGVYSYTLQTEGRSETRMCVLLRR